MLLVSIGASQSDKKNSIQKNQKSHNYISSKESYLQRHLHSHDEANIQLLKCSTREIFFPI